MMTDDIACLQCREQIAIHRHAYPDITDDIRYEMYRMAHGLANHNQPFHKEELHMAKLNTWDLVDAVLGVTRRVLLYGLPGTGKTYAASKRGLAKNQKVYEITVTEETPAAEIRGHFIPKGDQFVWHDGPGIMAWRQGARLVINEIDRASADTMSFLNALLDDPEFAEITLPTGEIVKPEQGFQVVATMNGEPLDLEPSLQDRFPVTLYIADVNPEAIAALDPDLRDAAKNTALIDNPDRRVSIRAWMEYANLRTKLAKEKDFNPKEATDIAAQAVFGKRASEALRAIAVNESGK